MADVSPSQQADGSGLIAAERARQRAKWGDRHDDHHARGQLAIRSAELLVAPTDAEIDLGGEFDSDAWGLVAKTRTDPIRRLVVAGALVAAEIDRLVRTGADLPAGQGLAGKIPGACTCTPGSVDVGCPVHFPQADPIADAAPRRSMPHRRARLVLSYSRLSQEAKDLMWRVLHGYHERSGAHPRTGSAAEVEAIAAGCLTADDHCVWVAQEVCDLIPGPRGRLTLNTDDERQVWLAVLCSEASSGAADDAVRAYRQRLPSYQKASSSFARERCERLRQATADSRRGGDIVVGDVREGLEAAPEQDDGTPTGPGWWWVWSATHPDGYGWVPVYVSCLGRDLVWHDRRDPKHYPVEQYEWCGRCVREDRADAARGGRNGGSGVRGGRIGGGS